MKGKIEIKTLLLHMNGDGLRWGTGSGSIDDGYYGLKRNVVG